MKRYIPIFAWVLLLAACPSKDPYQNVRTAINIARTVTAMTGTGIAAADAAVTTGCNSNVCIKVDPTKGAKYDECMKQDHSKNPEFIACYDKSKMPLVLKVWSKAQPIASSTWDAGDASVNLAEAIKKAKDGGDTKALEALCLKLDPDKGDIYKKCLEGQPVGKADWQSMLKTGACLVANILSAMPADYAKYIAALEAMLRTYGCKVTTWEQYKAYKRYAQVRTLVYAYGVSL